LLLFLKWRRDSFPKILKKLRFYQAEKRCSRWNLIDLKQLLARQTKFHRSRSTLKSYKSYNRLYFGEGDKILHRRERCVTERQTNLFIRRVSLEYLRAKNKEDILWIEKNLPHTITIIWSEWHLAERNLPSFLAFWKYHRLDYCYRRISKGSFLYWAADLTWLEINNKKNPTLLELAYLPKSACSATK
jgi:hypothetical protein